MRFHSLSALAIVFLLSFSPVASATIYEFDCQVTSTCPSSDGAGKMIASVFTFDDVTRDFRWTATFDTDLTETPDGVWFVINHGPEPEDSDKGLSIFYGDGASGRVSAYVYDNHLKKNSWQTAENFLETYPSSISFAPLGGDLVALDVALNVATVNDAFPSDPNWQGLFYQDSIGFWAAALSDTDMRFDSEGRITHFSYDKRSSYDRDGRLALRTEREIPEPATWLLLACGLAAITSTSRRRDP